MPRCRPTADMALNPMGDNVKKNEEVSHISKAPNLTENSRHSSIGLQLCVHTRDEGLFFCGQHAFSPHDLFPPDLFPKIKRFLRKGHFVEREVVN